MARWLVAGARGMLGQDLATLLESRGHEVTRADLPQLDILDPSSCRDHVAGHDVVVNVAAYTAVDAAEDDEPTAFAVNALGAATLARAVQDAGVALVHLSTDYVFAGDADTPYAADAPLEPRSAYGRTKAAGEWAVRVECERVWLVRTAWLYGVHGLSFPATMARLAGERETVEVVVDEVGQPTWTVDLADGIARLVEAHAPYGTYHGTGSGECSRLDLARAVFAELDLDPDRVRPTTREAFGLPANRPAYSSLDHSMWSAAGLDPLPGWRDALHRAAPTLFP
jgi:dTDP-4-dehydrorhamnose reductase